MRNVVDGSSDKVINTDNFVATGEKKVRQV
jgi:hypothetical protein